MEHTFEELKKKTVAQLREIASDIEHEAVQGYTQLNKEHLLKAVCAALGIDMHEHHVSHDSHKMDIKKMIRDLKKKRDKALQAKKSDEFKTCMKKIHHYKRVLRKAAD